MRITKIRNETSSANNICFIEIKRIVREFSEHLYANKLDYLHEMNKIWRYVSSKTKHNKIVNLNNLCYD